MTDPAEFAGITYDLNSSYTDRDGTLWFFEDSISEADGTWHMRGSDHCYVESLAEVVLHWGPLKLACTIPKSSLFYRNDQTKWQSSAADHPAVGS
ncbi:phiSA1p31-related protein [Streptomyces zhihengii]